MVKENEAEAKREKVAEHILLADGNEADSEEKANGIRYKLLENGKTFDWSWDDANELERVMLACFGAKTLATNVTSAARNGKNPLDANGQYDELVERFALIRSGQWIDRTREPGAPRVDKDALGRAIVRVMLKSGKITQDQVEATYAERRAKLDSDPKYLPFVRTNAQVAEAYAAEIGKQVATTDDL